MRTLFIKTLLLLVGWTIFPGTAAKAQPSPIDQYVADALKNNLVLHQKNLSLERALLSLKIANGMFIPSVALQGNYTSGDGGRNISFPVGDMLNPVYNTLNQLTDSNQFPQIENVNTNFLPHNFYDVKVRTSMPILNSELLYNKKIKQQQVVLQEFEQEIYKRELIRNIQVAYFNYLSAKEVINIYESALNRALENKRVNESLSANGKGLPAYILRSESEIETIKAQITEAQKQSENAQLYFNFLLNRKSAEAILDGYNVSAGLAEVSGLITAELSSLQREELKQVRESVSLQENVLKMNKLFWAPKLSGFVDVGSQYENWKFNDQSRYYLFGFQLDVPLFAGLTNRHKINQSRLDVKNSSLTENIVQKQLDMSTQMARNSLVSVYQGYQSSLKQREAAQSYQRLIDKGYREGVNTFIESIDARNQLTNAQLNVTLQEYRVLIAKANYERETALLPINN